MPDCQTSGGQIIIICEALTDTAALLDLDLHAVGRPSCRGGVGLLVDLVCRNRPKEFAIIADADSPGQSGARHLASRLASYASDGGRIVIPPAKDAREWAPRRPTRHDVVAAIAAATKLTLMYDRRLA